MALGGAETKNNEALNLIIDAGAEVANKLPPGTGSNIEDLNDPDKATQDVVENKEAFNASVKYFTDHPGELNTFLKNFPQNSTTMKKITSFGEKLTMFGLFVGGGILGGVTVANFGAIGAGLGAIGTGLALAGPTIGFALAGIAGLAVIAALAFAAYKYKDQIKDGAENIEKKVKHLLKNILDKLPTRVPNALKIYNNVANKEAQDRLNPQGNPLPDDIAFIGQYLLNKDGLAALKKHIKDSNGEILLAKGSKLTLADLERLEEKGKSTFESDKDEFAEVLKEFAPIMNKENEVIRKLLEGEKDAIHQGKNRQEPLPSSILYSGSVKNNEFLAQIHEDRRKVVKDLLQNIAGHGPELIGGLNKEFRKQIDLIGKLEGEGEEAATAVTTLVAQVNDVSEGDFKNWIEGLNDRVSQLKVEQAKTPSTKVDETKPPKKTESQSESVGP